MKTQKFDLELLREKLDGNGTRCKTMLDYVRKRKKVEPVTEEQVKCYNLIADEFAQNGAVDFRSDIMNYFRHGLSYEIPEEPTFGRSLLFTFKCSAHTVSFLNEPHTVRESFETVKYQYRDLHNCFNEVWENLCERGMKFYSKGVETQDSLLLENFQLYNELQANRNLNEVMREYVFNKTRFQYRGLMGFQEVGIYNPLLKQWDWAYCWDRGSGKISHGLLGLLNNILQHVNRTVSREDIIDWYTISQTAR
jgi:hypothetical protein